MVTYYKNNTFTVRNNEIQSQRLYGINKYINVHHELSGRVISTNPFNFIYKV
jgi:hypothetical protein